MRISTLVVMLVWAFTFVVSDFGCARLYADIVISPPDLSAGSDYRLVFVTSTVMAPSSSDIETYNTFVNDVANNLNGNSGSLIAGVSSWQAIGSTADIDARDNTSTNPFVEAGVPIYSVSGARLADDYADFWDGTLQNNTGGASGTERDTVPPTFSIGLEEIQLVYTGTSSSGTNDTNTPLGTQGFAITFGAAELIPGNGFADSWVAAGSSGIAEGAYYGISEVLTTPIPEPTGSGMALLFLVALIALSRRHTRLSNRCRA